MFCDFFVVFCDFNIFHEKNENTHKKLTTTEKAVAVIFSPLELLLPGIQGSPAL